MCVIIEWAVIDTVKIIFVIDNLKMCWSKTLRGTTLASHDKAAAP